MIGFFGKDIVFEVTDKRIMSIMNLSRTIQSRYAEHALLQNKPVSEFIGPNLDTVSFTVKLDAVYGINPHEQFVKWIYLAREGHAETFSIGGKAMGVDKWTVTNVTENWDLIWNQGELVKGSIDVELKEYVSTIPGRWKK